MHKNAIPALRVQTLGRFQVTRDDQPIPEKGWGTHRAKTVLKVLLTHYGQTLARDQILESVWHDARSPSATLRALYTAVSDLRSTLEPNLVRAADSHFVLSTEDGYQFNSQTGHVTLDKLVFEKEIVAARSYVQKSEWQDAANAYARAEALYAGEYLPDDVYADWSSAERERLRALFLTLLLENAEVHARLGLYREAIVRCRRALELDNCLEPAYRSLMVYYDVSGARPQALRAYTECEIMLQRELGVKPTRETIALHESIKATGSEYERADVPLTNLPIPSSSFIGRKRELAVLQEVFAHTRLLTLTGAGGSGKTRLALESAREQMDLYTNGVWWVELAALRDPALVVRAVAHALRVREIPNQTLVETVAHFLRNKQLLLVLDNCEHHIEASAQLAQELLSQCRELKILATSREPLGVAGELNWQVPMLTLPSSDSFLEEPLMHYEAIRLFVERAGIVNPTFSLTPQNAAAVVQVCQRLDGLPLAIELAAARCKLLSPEKIAARLDDRFALLTSGSRIAPSRQQTLRATLDWSYDLLSAQEQILLQRLSVFAGGFTLEAVEGICAEAPLSPRTILDVLTGLVNRSLVQLERKGQDTRYRMLETIHEYAREKLVLRAAEGLDASREIDRLRQRHRDYFIAFADQAEPKLRGIEQFEWLDRLEDDHDNLRAAWGYAIESDGELALRLAAALLNFWVIRAKSEGREWLAQLVERTNEWGQSAKRAHVLGVAGRLAHAHMDFVAAQELFEQALPIARRWEDKSEIAFILLWLGRTMGRQRDHQSARLLIRECLTIYQELQDEWGIAWALFGLGDAAYYRGDYVEAKERDIQSLAIFQDLGDRFNAAYVLNGLGEQSRLQDQYEEAGEYYQQSLEFFREIGSRAAQAPPTVNLAWVSLHSRDYVRAKALLLESLRLFKMDDNKLGMTHCLPGFAALLGVVGKPVPAARLFATVQALLEDLEMTGQLDPPDQMELEHYTAKVRTQLDEIAFAEAWAEGRAMIIGQDPAQVLQNVIEYALNETKALV